MERFSYEGGFDMCGHTHIGTFKEELVWVTN